MCWMRAILSHFRWCGQEGFQNHLSTLKLPYPQCECAEKFIISRNLFVSKIKWPCALSAIINESISGFGLLDVSVEK